MIKKELIFAAVLILIGAITSALTVEIVVRIFADNGTQYHLEMWKYARDLKIKSENPALAHVHRADQRLRLMGVEVSTNSQGLRDREFEKHKASGVKRILMLGDSLTFAWGVPQEQAFAKEIERLYEDRSIKTEVINSGVGNYNTGQEVEYFMTEGHKYDPDVVVLNYFINDAEPTPEFRAPNWLDRVCASCIYVRGALDTLTRILGRQTNWASYYQSLYEGEGWRRSTESLARLSQFCKTRGIRLILAHLPELHDVKNYRFQQVTDRLKSVAQKNKIEFIDLLPYLSCQESKDLWVSVEDPHPNSLGHRLIARGLFAALEPQLKVRETLECLRK